MDHMDEKERLKKVGQMLGEYKLDVHNRILLNFHSDSVVVRTEYENGAFTLRWKSRYAQSRPFHINVGKMEIPANPEHRCSNQLLCSRKGQYSGFFVDSDVIEGHSYVYSVVMVVIKGETEEIIFPVTIPLSPAQRRLLDRLEKSEQEPATEKLHKEALNFLSADKSLADLEWSELSQIQSDSTLLQAQKDARGARVTGYFRQLRQRLHECVTKETGT